MTAPHDAPTAADLVEAVREWIERDVSSIDAESTGSGRLKYHAKVASNVLAIVERELALGPGQADAHGERLKRLGVASDAELASQIRSGETSVNAEELRMLLRESVEDKLRVANPKYLNT